MRVTQGRENVTGDIDFDSKRCTVRQARETPAAVSKRRTNTDSNRIEISYFSEDSIIYIHHLRADTDRMED